MAITGFQYPSTDLDKEKTLGEKYGFAGPTLYTDAVKNHPTYGHSGFEISMPELERYRDVLMQEEELERYREELERYRSDRYNDIQELMRFIFIAIFLYVPLIATGYFDSSDLWLHKVMKIISSASLHLLFAALAEKD